MGAFMLQMNLAMTGPSYQMQPGIRKGIQTQQFKLWLLSLLYYVYGHPPLTKDCHLTIHN